MVSKTLGLEPGWWIGPSVEGQILNERGVGLRNPTGV
jgi:hypothetical protein